ncbi:MAG: hypothetical protein V1874_06030 [Spirochaetota bacterium]
MKNKYIFGIYFLIIVFFAGCTTGTGSRSGQTKEPWIENGQRLGTIIAENTASGKQLKYYDVNGKLHSFELRDSNNVLLPGVSTIKYLYNSEGKLIEEHCYNANGASVENKDGYAIKQLSYIPMNENDYAILISFLNKTGKPVCIPEGYAFKKIVYAGHSGKIKEMYFENEKSKPASVKCDGVSSVANVKYSFLEGIGEVTCGVYYGPSGLIIERKVLSGSMYYMNEIKNTNYNYPVYYAPPGRR